MPFKPMDEKTIRAYIKIAGWTLEKGKIDHNLYNEKGEFLCSVKISHGKRTKGGEVVAMSVKKITNEFKKRGLAWPPKKK